MQNTSKLWVYAAVLLFCCATIIGCKNKPVAEPEVQTPTENIDTEEATWLTAVEDYLVTEIGSHYTPGEVCIPYANIVATDDSNPEEMLVWGDFWVFLYNLSGDTLKTVSGGSHPGLMHVRQTDSGFQVIAFEAVEDGARKLERAKQIFGDKYEAFHAINSNDQQWEENRIRTTAAYVKKHQLSATMYQDFGWDPVSLGENQ